jgi:hypothetical protein
MRARSAWTVLVAVVLFPACAPSDKELCEDARKKLVECGSNDFECPDDLHDSVREQYECIVDSECNELADCAD